MAIAPELATTGPVSFSDVCIKRKIRNRLMALGHAVFVQSDDGKKDDYTSLRARAEGEIDKASLKDGKKLRSIACEKWIDVRSFGQLFAFKGDGKDGVSVGIRGPVSVQSAFSVTPVSVTSIQITKSVSGEGDGTKRASDTMGMKHRVDHGVYVLKGAMNPQLASLTGFSDADAQAIKAALVSLFEGDSSSARPEGSMEVVKVFWWQHNCPNGQYSSAKVHRTLKVEPKVAEPIRLEDYAIDTEDLPGLQPEVIEGR